MTFFLGEYTPGEPNRTRNLRSSTLKENKVFSFDIFFQKWRSKSISHLSFNLSGGYKCYNTRTDGGRVFLMGGAIEESIPNYSLVKPSSTFEYLRNSNTFVRKANMLDERNYFACTGFGDYIYAIGGKTMNGVTSKSIEYYSVLEDTWKRTKVKLNYARVFGSAC